MAAKSVKVQSQNQSRNRNESQQAKKAGGKEWNVYLTDANRFRLSREQLLRRKRLSVSKHNILASPTPSAASLGSRGSGKRRVGRSRKVVPKKKSLLDEEEEESDDESEDGLSSSLDRISSLDILTAPDDEPSERGREREKQLRAHSLQQQKQLKQKQHSRLTVKHSPLKTPRTSLSTYVSATSPSPATPMSITPSATEKSTPKTHDDKTKHRSRQSPRSSELTLTEIEMRDIGSMVDALHGEVSYYEQLTGKKSAIDIEVSDPPHVQL